MKLLKIVLAVLVLLAATFILFGEHLAGASGNAVINARLTTHRAPIAGQLEAPRLEFGTFVRPGDELARISNRRVDVSREGDLVLERATLSADLSQMRAQIDAIDTALARLRQRTETYAARQKENFSAVLAQAEANLSAARARQTRADAALMRSAELTSRGIRPASDLEDAQEASDVARLLVEQADAAVDVALIQLAAARDGVFLGDGFNDVPFSEQQIYALSLESEALGHRVTAVEARIAALDERLATERRQLALIGTATILSNVEGRLWETLATAGEKVERGQPLMRLVDCQSAVITLSVAESVYNDLEVGDAARFRLNGTALVVPATIARLAGPGAARVYENLAVTPSGEDLERYDVTLISEALRENPGQGCAIGRTGRAIFDDRPLDVLRDLFR